MRIRAADLLPTTYDQIIAEFTHRRLLASEREALVRAIINTTRWSAEAYGREKSASTDSILGYQNSTDTADELLTADRFCSKWATRNQIIALMQQASGLD